MKWAIFFLLVVYAALKIGRVVMTGTGSGYREADVGIWRKLKSGEPILLLIALLISMPPAMAATWYHHQKFDTVLRSSTNCYALISAYKQTPEIMRSNGEFAVYESAYGYRWSALDAAWQLGLKAGVTERKLDSTVDAVKFEYTRLTVPIREARLASVQRCLHPPQDQANA